MHQILLGTMQDVLPNGSIQVKMPACNLPEKTRNIAGLYILKAWLLV
jgi:hypothetical protein